MPLYLFSVCASFQRPYVQVACSSLRGLVRAPSNRKTVPRAILHPSRHPSPVDPFFPTVYGSRSRHAVVFFIQGGQGSPTSRCGPRLVYSCNLEYVLRDCITLEGRTPSQHESIATLRMTCAGIDCEWPCCAQLLTLLNDGCCGAVACFTVPHALRTTVVTPVLCSS